MNCRHCASPLEYTFLDLGFAPPSNAYLTAKDLSKPEIYYPLKLKVCDKCWLVQTEDYTDADALFSSDYAYFSSTSSGWLEHAKVYVQNITDRLELTENSYVVEIASNDGYLLQNFVEAGVPCLGIEPTDSTASAAEAKGIPVLRKFFGEVLAKNLVDMGKQADLVIGNNVYAHVPDINDFTLGLKSILKPGGTITLEFPHLMRLIEHCQFDTVYHEHFSYLSLIAVTSIFERCGLRIFDVDVLATHGGSLRIYGCHHDDPRVTENTVGHMLDAEEEFGLRRIDTYTTFQNRADTIKNNLLLFLLEQKKKGNKVVGYGAAAKGNTILNYAGVKPDLLPIVFDAAKSKQNKYLPGSHVPIRAPSGIEQYKPDVILILPWNIRNEVVKSLHSVNEWGGLFATVVPKIEIIEAM